jgi:hypothetical protein
MKEEEMTEQRWKESNDEGGISGEYRKWKI